MDPIVQTLREFLSSPLPIHLVWAFVALRFRLEIKQVLERLLRVKAGSVEVTLAEPRTSLEVSTETRTAAAVSAAPFSMAAAGPPSERSPAKSFFWLGHDLMFMMWGIANGKQDAVMRGLRGARANAKSSGRDREDQILEKVQRDLQGRTTAMSKEDRDTLLQSISALTVEVGQSL